MTGITNHLLHDPEALIALLNKQQREIDLLNQKVDRQDKTLKKKEHSLQKKDLSLLKKDEAIERLQARINELLTHRFGKRSEKFNPDQFLLFNEAELQAELNDSEDPEESADDSTVVEIKGHKRRRKKSPHKLPDHLPRVDVFHELDPEDRLCDCGAVLEKIDEEELEQLAIVPQQYYVIRHRRAKYACSCKQCMRTATMPAQPLPASQASPQIIAHAMVSKYLDGMPLYRQERAAGRSGVTLPRGKLARWMINGSEVFIPLLNLLIDTFFGYDIAQSDDTGIQVLKEDGRKAHQQSALWIRRGGPPDKPVVLVDYEVSKSGETAYRLLSEFRGTLVCDGAPNFNASVKRNGLSVALCNDHARRRFHNVFKSLSKEDKARAKGSVASEGLQRYNELYQIEARIKTLSAEEKLKVRQAEALPHWQSFIEWAKQTQAQGVRHPGTRDALSYLIKHAEQLQTYCYDGRLPISNIKSEHVAKTIAIARKNFIFADTPAGAEASGRIFSLIETARVNGHNPQQYLSVLLSELPNCSSVEQIEALLPWNITKEEVASRYASFPSP